MIFNSFKAKILKTMSEEQVQGAIITGVWENMSILVLQYLGVYVPQP